MHKIISFFIISLILSNINTFGALSSRSDTIDIRKTIIDFRITDFSNKIIYAKTSLDIKSLQNNVSELLFDLEGLIVDSVKYNQVVFPFVYTSPTLQIPLTSTTMNVNDTAIVDVYYHGIPIVDPSWGGFYFVGNYAFQMGVGINSHPHSFGRTWHPCFDNFVERSAYEFYVTANDSKVAVCNGLLLDSVANALDSTIRWHWKLKEEIPSYLACVAVGNYVFVKKNLNANSGIVDALITCETVDTNKVNGSFTHLQQSFSMLENRFGDYHWPRVGYSLVPFNGGAMEHATNISIGKQYIDGSLNYETLIAHELSHHWWGDLVTCSTYGDMWLNEGFASYCERLHMESVYGYDAYLKDVKNYHFKVLSQTHITDQGYRSIANIDSLHTYGSTVYEKSADVIHSLRTYMGDALFFSTLTSFLNTHKYQSINTIELRDYLSANSGISLNDFFSDWVLAPGFTHFSIDSTQVISNGNDYNVSVFLRQRKHHSNNYYNHVPLELAFYDSLMIPHIYSLEFTGRCMQFNVALPFNPLMINIDPHAKISDAVTDEDKIIKVGGIANFPQAKCIVKVNSLATNDSSWLHVEHHWVAPDRFKNPNLYPGFVLCDSRYWSISGINLPNLQGTLQFNYNAGSGNYYLDSTWLKNTEDSIRLFYRKDASEEWQFANDSLVTGSIFDKVGNIYAKEIKAGEFAFGIKRSGYIDTLVTDAPNGTCSIVSSLNENIHNPQHSNFLVYPNPSSHFLYIDLNEKLSGINLNDNIIVELLNVVGEVKYTSISLPIRNTNSINISMLASGIYFVRITSLSTHTSVIEKLIKE